MIEISNKVLFLLSFLVVAYLVIGGVAFYYLERDYHEETRPPDLTNVTEVFLASNPAFKREEVEVLVQTIVDAYVNATQVTSPVWTIGQGIHLAVTIITTIGYGDVVTKTPGGQWFTVFYGVVGIPLNLVMLGGVGTKMRQSMMGILRSIQRRRGETWSQKKNKVIGVTVVLLVGLIVMFIVPSFIFRITEKWSFTEAFYFSFITLATVGFGDYIASRESEHLNKYLVLYRLLLFVWIYLGLAWLSTLLSVLQDMYNTALETGKHKLKNQFSKRKISSKTGVVTRQNTEKLDGNGRESEDQKQGDHVNGMTVVPEVRINDGYAPDIITPVNTLD